MTASLDIREPTVRDGAHVAQLAARAGSLDVNTPYAYVLWCRDFAGTSIVARSGPETVGFITGYCRPVEPSVLFVWQVAVDPVHRGRRVAGAMLDALVDRVGPTHVEATVTDDNRPSLRLFTAFAERRGAPLLRSPLFGTDLFPDSHDAEDLLRIGPLR
jgi:L-2,4-diaminobutyric acid acetyltransferase